MDEVVKRIFVIGMLTFACLSLAGCQHARSFLQMDSNSNVPFLGLQLSVDASDAQRSSERCRSDIVAVANTFSETNVKPAHLRAAASPRGLIQTSTRAPQTASVKLSLPRVDVRDDPQIKDEVANILSRWQNGQ